MAEPEEIITGVRRLRDAFLAIANAGPDMPTNAIRAIASLGARAADELLVSVAS